MLPTILIVFVIVLIAINSPASTRFYERRFQTNQKAFIVAGILTFLLHIAANLLAGGYSPPLSHVLGGIPQLVLGLTAIIVQLMMWIVALIVAIQALKKKNYQSFILGLLVFALISIPILLPLPALFP
ncbi:MAG TPA: hypothetical protein VGK48_09625 [Terriglobia bacterium]|jgi:hypothetical protein